MKNYIQILILSISLVFAMSSPGLAQTPSETAVSLEEEAGEPLTEGFELGASQFAGGMIAGGAAAGLVLMMMPSCGAQNIVCALGDVASYSLAFATFTTVSTVAVWAIGESSGFDGSLIATYFGSLGGLLLAAVVADSDVAMAVLAVGAPLGGTIGYQLSMDGVSPGPSVGGEASFQLVNLKF